MATTGETTIQKILSSQVFGQVRGHTGHFSFFFFFQTLETKEINHLRSVSKVGEVFIILGF